MKLSVVLFFLCLTQILATESYAQLTKVTLQVKDATVKDVLNQIEENSEFFFLYNSKLVDVNRKLSLDAEEKKIDEILSFMFKGTDVGFKVVDKQIVLTKTDNLKAYETPGDQQVNRTVTGTITDASNGEVMPGVSVLIKGTTVGSLTDINGKFSLVVPDPNNAVLVFSFVGYSNQEVPVGVQNTINLSLEAAVTGLDEVVVIGYGTASKRNLAAASAVVNTDELTSISTTDARQALQGKLSGVKVVSVSGDPGASTKLIIRGMGSFSDTDPLYVIDGIQGGDINSIPSENIESITVLKDAATTAIYGSAAANGVVLVTTKSGKKGSVIVNYTGSIGYDNIAKRLDMLNAAQYVDLVKDIQETNNQTLTAKLSSQDVLIDLTDWQEAAFRKALFTDHNLSFSGGAENVTYSFVAGYLNQESTVIDRDLQRITINAKLSENLFKSKLRLNQSLRIKEDLTNGLIADLNNTLRMAPYTPILDPTNIGGYARMDKLTDLQDANNPYGTVYNSDYKGSAMTSELDFSAELDIMRGLMFRTQGRITVWNGENYTYNRLINGGNFARTELTMSQSLFAGRDFILENFFSFNRNFGKHYVSATLGNAYDPAWYYRSMDASAVGFSSDVLQNISLAKSTSITGASVNSGSSRLSYFGRAGYTYNNKYIFNVSLRRDASSKFGINNRWGTFYGIGLGWAVSDEAFMQDIPLISNLKLRASFGKLGNDNIPSFLGMQSVWKGISNTVVYSFGDNDGVFVPGSTINTIPNPDLRWEQTNQLDVGFDLGLFDNKINIVVDYFHRNNQDLLIETLLPFSVGVGLPNSQGTKWLNAASMVNSGVEAAVTYSHSSGQFKWDLSFNATYSVNEVTALGTTGNLPITGGSFGAGYATLTDIGHPIASFYGYAVDHVIVSQDELNALNASAVEASGGSVTQYQINAKPGDYVWKDIDRNGYINVKDRTFIGNPSPKLQYGGTFNASYKGFDLQVMAYGVAGVDVCNANNYWWKGTSKPFNTTTDLLRRWRKDGDVTDITRAGQNSGANLAMSSFYIEKGDFLKIRNIAIGYTLPAQILNSIFTKIRVSASIQNALTITKYTGYDPEVSSSGGTDDDKAFIFSNGIDNQLRPVPRMVRLGLQLTF